MPVGARCRSRYSTPFVFVSPKQHGIVLVLMHHTILLYCPSTLYVATLFFLLLYRNCKDLLSTGGLLKINPWATAPLHSIATAWVSDYDIGVDLSKISER